MRRLAKRVGSFGYFAATEVRAARGDDDYLNIHSHGLLVTPPLRGRAYLSELAWHQLWREVCTEARDIQAERVIPCSDLLQAVQYATKDADILGFAKRLKVLLADPEVFLSHADALLGTARFFGPLARGRQPFNT
jgi:hypothetical protein